MGRNMLDKAVEDEVGHSGVEEVGRGGGMLLPGRYQVGIWG